MRKLTVSILSAFLMFAFTSTVSAATLDAPTNLGWNIRSESSYPGDRPVDLVCGQITNADFDEYGNGKISQNWKLVNAPTDVKYQRQYMWPSSSNWSTDGKAYINTYIPFSTFGSSTGTEGEWNSRVRAWIDVNGNNSLDEGIDTVSDWSNECAITYDRTAPAKPTGLKFLSADGNTEYQCGDIAKRQVSIPVWDEYTEDDFDHYEYSSFHPNGSQGLNEKNLYVAKLANSWMPPTDGAYGFSVRTVDKAGNKSPWSLSAETLEGSCQIIYDSIAPIITFEEPKNGSTHSGTTNLKATCNEDCDYINFWWRADGGTYGDYRYHYVHKDGTVFEWGLNTLDAQKADGTTCAMADGVYYLYAAGKDLAGNWAKTSEIRFVVDNTTKAEVLMDSGVPGKGLEDAPGLQKPFNPKSQAEKNAGKKK